MFSGPRDLRPWRRPGHIAGVVNPPAGNKYAHWTNGKNAKRSRSLVRGAPRKHPGSWWPKWYKWVGKKSGAKIAARVPGDGDLPVIEDAPGSYVKVMATGKE